MITCEAFDLKLNRAFATSRSLTKVSRSYFLHGDGAVGEAAPVRFYGEIEGTFEAAFAYVRDSLPEFGDPRSVWPRLNQLLGYNFALKCGLDLLYWDHWGVQQNAQIHELLGVPHEEAISSAFSIGVASANQMQQRVRERPEYKVYKLKVGFDHDVEAVAAVRQVTDAPLYVDANGGWTVKEACTRMPQLEKLGVVLCEQPILSGVRADWDKVREATSVPVIVDEYCQRPEDVAHWTGWVDGINVKLQKCGGITPAFDMIKRAREEGLGVMIGCMIESSVSIAAALHLAPLADYIDLDSHLYLEFDPYEGVRCEKGRLRLSALPGLGVNKREKVGV